MSSFPSLHSDAVKPQGNIFENPQILTKMTSSAISAASSPMPPPVLPAEGAPAGSPQAKTRPNPAATLTA